MSQRFPSIYSPQEFPPLQLVLAPWTETVLQSWSVTEHEPLKGDPWPCKPCSTFCPFPAAMPQGSPTYQALRLAMIPMNEGPECLVQTAPTSTLHACALQNIKNSY